MIDISRAERIDGWMTPLELSWLAQQATTKSTIIEVGCFVGRSTRALAEHALGVVYAVDPWSDSWHESVTSHAGAPLDLIQRYPVPMQAFLRHTWGLTNLFIYRGTLETLPHLRADMVFIDGDHSYDAVARDLDRAMVLLTKPERRRVGLLCGHDYLEPLWPGVSKAVDTIVGPVQVVPQTSIWWREV